MDASAYECPLVDETCATRADGYYKDTSCRSYFYCANGRKLTYVCAENQMFDGERCVLNRNGHYCHPGGGGVCAGKPDGYYADEEGSGCRDYYFCLRGDKVNMLTCRDNRLFNGVKCVPAASYRCGGSAISECVPRNCGGAVTECDHDGFFQDIDSGCTSYYFCIAGKRTTLSCSEGYVYDGESCVSELKYKCPAYCASPNDDSSCRK